MTPEPQQVSTPRQPSTCNWERGLRSGCPCYDVRVAVMCLMRGDGGGGIAEGGKED